MPELTAIALLALLGAYLIGSLSSAVMLCKVSGLPDPRTQGSGNPGATNVLRMGSKKLAAMVLLIDVLKGVVPVLIGRMLDFDINILALIAFLHFLGTYTLYFFSLKVAKVWQRLWARFWRCHLPWLERRY